MWRDILVILVYALVLILAHTQEGDKQLRELGLQTCVEGFVVHRDKIIRTQDSTEMGAKFLNEVDVDTRLECMRWCCETQHCDVFIFEEKKPGSCYLFHCGPPHDFKCKFTNHANYSSAVLQNYDIQNADALEEQIRRNQQEHELKSLRKLDPPSREYDYFTNPPAPKLTHPPPTPSTTTTTLAPVKVPTCSRNQFECRSNDDCIAIYNVCDGIPQCADGSDEAAELGCPSDKTSPPPPPLPPLPPVIVATPKPQPYIPPDIIRYQQQQQQQQQQQIMDQQQQYNPMMYETGQEINNKNNWKSNQLRPQEPFRNAVGYLPQPPQDELQQQQPQQQQQQQQQPLPVNYKQPFNQWNNNYNRGPGIYEQQSKIGNGVAVLDYMHDPRNVVYAPAAYEQEQQPHIFNHKVPGMRLEEIEAQNGMYGGQDPNQRIYAPYYPGVIHRQEPWQEPPQGPVVAPTQAPPTTTTSTTTVATPPPCDPAEKHVETVKVQSSEGEKKLKQSIDEAHHHQQASDSKQPKDMKVSHEIKPVPEKLKSESHKAHETEQHLQAEQPHSHIVITDHVRRVPVVHEDSMSRPKGAVISLALGLSVTAVMAILIACRLRVVKRRGGRRGHHDSYAHDADYLVNGMYL